MHESRSRKSPALNRRVTPAGEDPLASYISTLEEKYGLATTEPLPDDVTILVERLNLLKRSGGRRTV